MTADIATMFLMIITISTSLAITVGLIARSEEPEGTGYWSLALLFNTLAYVLYILRGQISDWLSVVVANVAMSSAFALFLLGILQFQKRTISAKWVWAPVVIEAAIFAFLLPWQNARNVANAVILSAQITWIVSILLQYRHRTVGRGQYFLTAAFLMLICALVIQGVYTLVHLQETHAIMKASVAQIIIFMVSPVATIVMCLGLVVMIKERADQRNLNLATRDELTGLLNRRSIMEAISQNIALAKRGGQSIALLMVDIDFFKRVNDNYGHQSGDRVLQLMAKTMADRVRGQDIVGRLGGEEFLVILPNTSVEGAMQLGDTLRAAVETTQFHCADGFPIHISVSIGVCGLSPTQQTVNSDLVNQADQALYQAKQSGRNRVEQYDPNTIATTHSSKQKGSPGQCLRSPNLSFASVDQ